jgi:fatty acid desaturase
VNSLAGLDNWHGPLALATDWAFMIAVAVVCQLLFGWVAWAFYFLVALPLIGTRQRALATLLHESAHGTLAKNKRLNKFLGTWLSGWVISSRSTPTGAATCATTTGASATSTPTRISAPT